MILGLFKLSKDTTDFCPPTSATQSKMTHLRRTGKETLQSIHRRALGKRESLYSRKAFTLTLCS